MEDNREGQLLTVWYLHTKLFFYTTNVKCPDGRRSAIQVTAITACAVADLATCFSTPTTFILAFRWNSTGQASQKPLISAHSGNSRQKTRARRPCSPTVRPRTHGRSHALARLCLEEHLAESRRRGSRHRPPGCKHTPTTQTRWEIALGSGNSCLS